MTPAKKAGAGSAAVIAAATSILVIWEGTDLVAKKDMIGTGHPMTYCHGQTDEFGKVKEGQRFTPAQCKDLLAKSLPKYLVPLQKCVTAELPVKTMAALLDAAYNAGPAAVCRSPMVKRMNAGDIKGGCDAFEGWYIRSDGQVRRGLVARRSGLQGDKRVNEKQLCLQGWVEGVEKPKPPTFMEKLKFIIAKVKSWFGF
jgi:lysozyme